MGVAAAVTNGQALVNGNTATSPTKAKLKVNNERNIENVVLGDILFPTWYPSFYPEDLIGNDKSKNPLYICQWCFKYAKEIVPFMAHVVSDPSEAHTRLLTGILETLCNEQERACWKACLLQSSLLCL
jgi:hypothetical protein